MLFEVVEGVHIIYRKKNHLDLAEAKTLIPF